MFKRLSLVTWQRNLWTVVAVEVLAMLAFNAGAILIPYYVQQLGITGTSEVAAWTGAYQSIGAIGFAVSTPIWGALGDRYGRKLMLIRAMAGTAIVLTTTGFVRTPAQLMALRAIQGFMTGTPAAATALVAVGSPKDRLAYALGLVQTALFVGGSLGPMFGGYVADAYGYRATFYASGIIVTLAFVLVVTLIREPQESAAVAARARQENPISAFRSLLGLPAVLTLVAMSFIINLVYGLMGPVLPLFIQALTPNPDRLASIAGTVSGVAALTAAISALVVGRMADRIGHRLALLGCSIGTAILFIPQALARSTTMLGAAMGVQGLFRGGMGPSLSAMTVNSASKDKAGVALGLSSSASSVGFAVGPILGATLMSLTSAPVVFLFSGALFLLIATAVPLVARQMAVRPEPGEQVGG